MNTAIDYIYYLFYFLFSIERKTTKQRDRKLWRLIEQHSRGEIKAKVMWQYLENKY